MSRAGLLKMDHLAFAFRTNNRRLKVQKIAVVALLIKGFDIDQSITLVDRHFGGEIRVLQTAHAPLGNLGPKLSVLIPV